MDNKQLNFVAINLGLLANLLLAALDGVEQVEEIHAHRFGPYFVLNLTVGVNGRLSIYQGDAIACRVEQTLYQNIPYLHRVYVHYHPARAEVVSSTLLCEPKAAQPT